MDAEGGGGHERLYSRVNVSTRSSEPCRAACVTGLLKNATYSVRALRTSVGACAYSRQKKEEEKEEEEEEEKICDIER